MIAPSLLPVRALARRSWVAFAVAVPICPVLAATGSGRAAGVRVVALAGIGLALWVSHGIVGRDFRSGVAALWLQKPVSPVSFYLAALARTIALLALALVPMSLAVAVLEPEPVLAQLREGLAYGLPFVVVSACAAFGLSACGVRADSFLAFALVFFVGTFAGDVLVDPEAFGAWAPVAHAIRLPLPEIEILSSALAGDGMLTGRAFWRVAAYAGAWTAIGAAGVAVRSRQPIGAVSSD